MTTPNRRPLPPGWSPCRGRSGSWGLFISKEVDDPGMIELLYSHQSTRLPPICRIG